MSLMQYIAPQPSPRRGEAPLHGADKYHGAISANYDAKRQGDAKWLLEQYWIETMLEDLPAGSLVLDVPCGTGRFFQFYGSKGFVVKALDKSVDQLQQAATKLQGLHAQNLVDGNKFKLAQGDVLKLGAPDKCVDAAVMCRLSRWLSPDELVVALKELQRVTRQRIILTARIANHPHARTIDLIESALSGTVRPDLASVAQRTYPGALADAHLERWAITRNEVGSDMDYRILELRPC